MQCCFCYSLLEKKVSYVHISGYRLQDFEIRVGLDDTDLGNNAICYKQLEEMPEGATIKFKCQEVLYGSWISVN